MKIIIAAILALSVCARVNAADLSTGANTKDIGSMLDTYGVYKYDLEIKSAVGEIEGLEGESFSDIVFGILDGSLSLTFYDALKLCAGRLFKEVYDSAAIMRNMLIIAILGAVIKSLSWSFGGSPVGEIGFYVIYIALVSLIIASFASASVIAADSIARLSGFARALIPLIIALLAASGRYAISFVFPPATMGVIQISTYIISNFVIKAIIFIAAVQMVGFMLPNNAFDGFGDLGRKIIGKGLKLTAVIFMSVITLRSATAPLVGGIIGKGAKLAVSGVPVVGQVFAGAVDSVYYWGNAVKNGVAAAAVMVIAFICFTPVLKLTAIALIYKLTAALVQPVADERVTDCINAAGDYASLFISAVVCVGVMFTVLMMMVMAAAIG